MKETKAEKALRLLCEHKIKYYLHSESLSIGSGLVAIDIGFDRPKWVMKEDQKKYKLKLWNA